MATTQQRHVSLRVNPELWKRVKTRAAELEITVSAIADAAFTRWLDDPASMPAANHAWVGAFRSGPKTEALKALGRELTYAREE